MIIVALRRYNFLVLKERREGVAAAVVAAPWWEADDEPDDKQRNDKYRGSQQAVEKEESKNEWSLVRSQLDRFELGASIFVHDRSGA
jgi:hypothetical protein